jgi:serine/threonine protein kinase
VPLLTCFLHPVFQHVDRELDERCPTCDRRYDFPLEQMPETIADYKIDSAISRGFYAATYRATVGPLEDEVVLKVAPVDLYAYKDFVLECKEHKRIAAGTEHLVKIRSFRENVDVTFGDVTIKCHVAELELANGPTLRKFAQDPQACTAMSLAQVAIDLFSLLQELEQQGVYHNDLHADNIIIETIPATRWRTNTPDGSIRAVAIDLGSASDDDRQDANHIGDAHNVIRHVFNLLTALLERPGDRSELDYRVALTLEETLRSSLHPDPAKGRPDHESAIRRIREVCDGVFNPWQKPGGLSRFADAYNAQQLHSWFVPQLLVDPQGEWLTRITSRGPQVITGIRGCGKTMLLRALQSHARIFDHIENNRPVDTAIADDGYIGLYVSSSRLLDPLGHTSRELHEPYSRLFVAYVREAVRTLMHLQTIRREPDQLPLLVHDAHTRLATFVADRVTDTDHLTRSGDLRSLEIALQAVLNTLERGESSHTLQPSPTVAFPDLAEAVLACSTIWSSCQVFFLLDDVSTRHLDLDGVGKMLSLLLFSRPTAAFKLTTELQTFEYALRSPALLHFGNSDREFDVFDLGAAVNARLRDGKSAIKGVDFLEQILAARAKYSHSHPPCTPKQFLGNRSLESIATMIVTTTSNSNRRKEVYQGLQALTALCVGDLGDVIKIYESIVRRAGIRGENPASGQTQTEAIREHAARRLFNLRRRQGNVKTFATEFAKASHDLMLRSSQAPRTPRGSTNKLRKDLRQYNSIYVRLEAESDFKEIMDLLDAGVFAMEGGTDAPRSKTRDSDPVQQFKLTYRKLLGIHNFIGLAERDRFELSGPALREYLTEPVRGREILTANSVGPMPAEDSFDDPDFLDGDVTIDLTGQLALSMGELAPIHLEPQPLAALKPVDPSVQAPSAREIAPNAVKADVLVLGLGFEERALESAKRLLTAVEPTRVILVRYPAEPGLTDQIRAAVAASGAEPVDVDDTQVLADPGVLDLDDVTVCVDVTALAKPLLFKITQEALRRGTRTLVGHTRAEEYFPNDADIERVMTGRELDDDSELLDALTELHTGESPAYRFDRLQSHGVDESRSRVLMASVTAKHQRLQALLGERVYDVTLLACPMPGTPRSDLARLAARVELGELMTECAYEVDTDDLVGHLDLLTRLHQKWFVGEQHLVELSLTGSKLNAVACAAVSLALPVSNSWYVAPESYYADKFTKGTGETRMFDLSLRPAPTAASKEDPVFTD